MSALREAARRKRVARAVVGAFVDARRMQSTHGSCAQGDRAASDAERLRARYAIRTHVATARSFAGERHVRRSMQEHELRHAGRGTPTPQPPTRVHTSATGVRDVRVRAGHARLAAFGEASSHLHVRPTQTNSAAAKPSSRRRAPQRVPRQHCSSCERTPQAHAFDVFAPPLCGRDAVDAPCRPTLATCAGSG